jgi:hypothetical protein
MDISLRLKAVQELKNLQTEVKAAQEEKQARQAQLEPFQQEVERNDRGAPNRERKIRTGACKKVEKC